MLNFIYSIADLVNVTMTICDLTKKLIFVLLMLLSDFCFPAQMEKKKKKNSSPWDSKICMPGF